MKENYRVSSISIIIILCLMIMPVINANDLQLFLENQAPTKPIVSGQEYVDIDEYGLFYANSNDPDGDMIYYRFDFGDGTVTGWDGPYLTGCSFSHQWDEIGSYDIKVQAMDEHEEESEWSDVFSVTVGSYESIEFLGGLGATVLFTNLNSKKINHIDWNIYITKETIHEQRNGIVITGKVTDGDASNIESGGIIQFSSKGVFGFGKLFIEWCCDIDYEDGSQGQMYYWYKEIFVIGPFVIIE